MENENEIEVEVDEKEEQVKEEAEEGPPPGYQTILQSLPKSEPDFNSHTLPIPPLEEIGQLVCGSCRSLLKYPLGSTQVQCSCCFIVNFVLQAHQVGQVKCGSCKVLLMFPHGASKVQCSSCQFVTEIDAHNQRPPWSVQQGQPLPLPCPNPSQ